MVGVLLSAGLTCALCELAGQAALADVVPASPTPTPVACAQANAPARTIHAVEPELPEQAQHYGVGGRVVVTVAVNADGRLVSARATSWSSRFLVRSAVAAARASTFAPALRSCMPVAGSYVFVVDYGAPSPPPALRVDPVVFFPGVWRCLSPSGEARTLIFVRDGEGLSETDGSVATSLAPDQYRMWRIRRNGQTVGWAFPWVDESWTWGTPSEQADIRFRRVDPTTFAMSTVVGTPLANIEKTERCTRVANAT